MNSSECGEIYCIHEGELQTVSVPKEEALTLAVGNGLPSGDESLPQCFSFASDILDGTVSESVQIDRSDINAQSEHGDYGSSDFLLPLVCGPPLSFRHVQEEILKSLEEGTADGKPALGLPRVKTIDPRFHEQLPVPEFKQANTSPYVQGRTRDHLNQPDSIARLSSKDKPVKIPCDPRVPLTGACRYLEERGKGNDHGTSFFKEAKLAGSSAEAPVRSELDSVQDAEPSSSKAGEQCEDSEALRDSDEIPEKITKCTTALNGARNEPRMIAEHCEGTGERAISYDVVHAETAAAESRAIWMGGSSHIFPYNNNDFERTETECVKHLEMVSGKPTRFTPTTTAAPSNFFSQMAASEEHTGPLPSNLPESNDYLGVRVREKAEVSEGIVFSETNSRYFSQMSHQQQDSGAIQRCHPSVSNEIAENDEGIFKFVEQKASLSKDVPAGTERCGVNTIKEARPGGQPLSSTQEDNPLQKKSFTSFPSAVQRESQHEVSDYASQERPFVPPASSNRFKPPKRKRTRVEDLDPAQVHVCSLEDCRKKFAKKYNLKIHERRHRGDLPFICKQCGKKFMWYSSFTRHLKVHNDRPQGALKKARKRSESEKIKPFQIERVSESSSTLRLNGITSNIDHQNPASIALAASMCVLSSVPCNELAGIGKHGNEAQPKVATTPDVDFSQIDVIEEFLADDKDDAVSSPRQQFARNATDTV